MISQKNIHQKSGKEREVKLLLRGFRSRLKSSLAKQVWKIRQSIGVKFMGN